MTPEKRLSDHLFSTLSEVWDKEKLNVGDSKVEAIVDKRAKAMLVGDECFGIFLDRVQEVFQARSVPKATSNKLRNIYNRLNSEALMNVQKALGYINEGFAPRCGSRFL